MNPKQTIMPDDSKNWGYISLYRKIWESDYWPSNEGRPFNRLEAWIDLLLLANYKDREIGNIALKRGQFITSKIKLSKRWRWSEGKVRRFLNASQKRREVDLKTEGKATVITICNYEDYQNTRRINGGQTARKRRNDGGETATTNNINKDNKDNKDNKKSTETPSTQTPVERFQEAWDKFELDDIKKKGIDTDNEFLKMKLWVKNNPKNAKKDYRKFITNWFIRTLKDFKPEDEPREDLWITAQRPRKPNPPAALDPALAAAIAKQEKLTTKQE